MSVDPLAEKYPNVSPYAYTFQNPVKYTDPTGMESEETNKSNSPIYGTDGTLLGTDENGLKGTPIVMNKENFKQGMSHEEAVSYSTYIPGESEYYGFDNKEAIDKYMGTQITLKDRPDYDGYLTLSEANNWYNNGNGRPLFVDASKIDLWPVTTGDFKGEGESRYYNFFFTPNTDTGLVYGSIKLTLTNEEKGTVKLGADNNLLDKYDFDQKSRNGTLQRDLRNIGTKIGGAVAGKGTPFEIYNYGNGKIKK